MARAWHLHHSPLLTRTFSGRSRSLKLWTNWRTDCKEARSSLMNSTGMDTHTHGQRHTHQSHCKRIISASSKTSKSVLIISYSRLGGFLHYNTGSAMLLLLWHIISKLIFLPEHHQSLTPVISGLMYDKTQVKKAMPRAAIIIAWKWLSVLKCKCV